VVDDLIGWPSTMTVGCEKDAVRESAV